MMEDLKDVLAKRRGGRVTAPKPAEPAPAEPEAEGAMSLASMNAYPGGQFIDEEFAADPLPLPAPRVAQVEVEAVIGGVLQRVRLDRIAPQDVLAFLQGLDPQVKVRNEFPMKGGGSRVTHPARALGIIVSCRGDFRSVELLCQNGDEFTVSVSKRNVDEFLPKLQGLGRLQERNLLKITEALQNKGKATALLSEDEYFGVLYSEYEGNKYLEDMMAAPPATGASIAT